MKSSQPKEASSSKEDSPKLLEDSILRTMRKIVPSHLSISNDAEVFMRNCVEEFASAISNQAISIAAHQNSDVLSERHIQEAINSLGYSEMSAFVRLYIDKMEKQDISRLKLKKKSVGEKQAMPPSSSSSLLLPVTTEQSIKIKKKRTQIDRLQDEICQLVTKGNTDSDASLQRLSKKFNVAFEILKGLFEE